MTTIQSTAMTLRYATRLKFLVITLAVLSIGLVLVLTHNREAHSQTVGRLRSSWFGYSNGSQGPVDTAVRRPADSLFALRTTGTAHS
jgi:hypothetical protein